MAYSRKSVKDVDARGVWRVRACKFSFPCVMKNACEGVRAFEGGGERGRTRQRGRDCGRDGDTRSRARRQEVGEKGETDRRRERMSDRREGGWRGESSREIKVARVECARGRPRHDTEESGAASPQGNLQTWCAAKRSAPLTRHVLHVVPSHFS